MQTSHTQVRRVLVLTLVLNIAVALSKIAVGLMTGALAVLADGFHSLSDAAGNVAALVANALAAQPPDADHPYGHSRFETIGALMIGMLLMLTAWELLGSAGARLFTEGTAARVTPLTVWVLVVTLLVNIAISTYQRRAGERLHSQILLADAANTRTDVYVTLSVLGSTALVWAGFAWMDTVVALVVVGLIVRAAFDVLWRAGGVLVDTAPYQQHTLHSAIVGVPQVVDVCRVRSRGTPSAAHIDVDVSVPAEMTCAQTSTVAASIRSHITEAVRKNGGDVAEIEVHFSPAASAWR